MLSEIEAELWSLKSYREKSLVLISGLERHANRVINIKEGQVRKDTSGKYE